MCNTDSKLNFCFYNVIVGYILMKAYLSTDKPGGYDQEYIK